MSLVERYLNQMEWDEPLCNPEMHSVVGELESFLRQPHRKSMQMVNSFFLKKTLTSFENLLQIVTINNCNTVFFNKTFLFFSKYK